MNEKLIPQLDYLLNRTQNDSNFETEIFRWIFTQATSVPLSKRPVRFDKFVKIMEMQPDEFLEEIRMNDDWLINTNRQKSISVQKNTQSINLRQLFPIQGLNGNNNQDTIDSELYDKYPKLTSFLNEFAISYAQGSLARAMIVRLEPGKQVYPHVDGGFYYLIRDRYHFVLESEGSRMRVHDEESIWKSGEMWWFHNKLRHEAFNDSDKWRTHVIFDVLPDRNLDMMKILRYKDYSSRNIPMEIINNIKL